MEIKEGYVYHIKDEYFNVIQDPTLMRNHENGKARPTLKIKHQIFFGLFQ